MRRHLFIVVSAVVVVLGIFFASDCGGTGGTGGTGGIAGSGGSGGRYVSTTSRHSVFEFSEV
jgi:hypothetical protein